MVRLVGYEVRQGEFEDEKTKRKVQYDSTVLHVLSDERKEVTGFAVENVKCSNEKFELIGVATLDEALEHEVFLVADPTTEKNGKMAISKMVVMGMPVTEKRSDHDQAATKKTT